MPYFKSWTSKVINEGIYWIPISIQYYPLGWMFFGRQENNRINERALGILYIDYKSTFENLLELLYRQKLFRKEKVGWRIFRNNIIFHNSHLFLPTSYTLRFLIDVAPLINFFFFFFSWLFSDARKEPTFISFSRGRLCNSYLQGREEPK